MADYAHIEDGRHAAKVERARRANGHGDCYFYCENCEASSVRLFLQQSGSDAEWHNANTGHDVTISTPEDIWTLTDEGWVTT